jgi:hypothetical protein
VSGVRVPPPLPSKINNLSMIYRHLRRLFHVATWRSKTRVKTNWLQKPQASTRNMIATFQRIRIDIRKHWTPLDTESLTKLAFETA